MGSTGRLYIAGAPDGVEPRLRARLDELEQRWSRFVDTSEVSRLNAAAGTAVVVSSDTLLLVQRARSASRRTRGWFDPTLLGPLEAAGYDRSFDLVATPGLGDLVVSIDHRTPDRSPVVHDWGAACRLILMDRSASTVTVPAGIGFDPGGIGKGLAADLVLAQAIGEGATAAMVNLGGDIAVGGHAPDGGWLVNVEDPFHAGIVAESVRIPWGAVATSSKARRRWRSTDGDIHHHLIDPATSAPSASDVAAATVIAGTCWQAESFAKAAVLAGSEIGIDLLEASGVEGLLFDERGRLHLTAGMPAYLEGARV